jgi:hypothetical protein
MAMKTNMKPELIEITPELAAEWLKFNVENRKLPVGNSQYYARLIEAGEFLLTHQAMAFTGTRQNPERLLDGQTRLTAVIKSGKPIWQWVFWNASAHTFPALDGGKQRSFADHHGWDKKRIAFVNILFWLSRPTIRKITKSEADKIWDVYGPSFTHLMAVCPSEKKFISCSAVKAATVMAMSENPDYSDKIAMIYRNMVLDNLNELPQSACRLYPKLMTVIGGGRDAIWVQFPFTHKALTPRNWNLTKLYGPEESYFTNLADKITSITGL